MILRGRAKDIPPAYINGIGVALAANSLTQEEACEHAKGCSCDTAVGMKVLERLYRRTEISSRSIVLEKSNSEGLAQFYPRREKHTDAGPSTAERMERYKQEVIPLALTASRNALDGAGCTRADIEQLITVSCTGFFSPGFDLALINELPLSPATGRTHVGFMGCHGSLNALRVASSFCAAGQSPILLCAAELCSLHFQYGWEADNLLANSLFSDGSAALVLSTVSSAGAWRVASSGSFVIPTSAEEMTWTIGNNGFAMTISPQVPELIRQNLKPWIEQWLLSSGLALQDIASWAIHPGGPRILEAVQDCLQLNDEELAPSRRIFAECGNMSSPTVLFILNHLRNLHHEPPCVMLAFGPGLTVEAALLLS